MVQARLLVYGGGDHCFPASRRAGVLPEGPPTIHFTIDAHTPASVAAVAVCASAVPAGCYVLCCITSPKHNQFSDLNDMSGNGVEAPDAVDDFPLGWGGWHR